MSFLTAADLEQYTGVKQNAAQIRFLRKWSVRHVVNRLGRPVVTWDAVNRTGSKADRPRVEPDFAAIGKAV
jgi:Domain of unknown function (DUF4224)